jgi:hypothetical protein
MSGVSSPVGKVSSITGAGSSWLEPLIARVAPHQSYAIQIPSHEYGKQHVAL